jgi:hypothetical protein
MYTRNVHADVYITNVRSDTCTTPPLTFESILNDLRIIYRACTIDILVAAVNLITAFCGQNHVIITSEMFPKRLEMINS